MLERTERGWGKRELEKREGNRGRRESVRQREGKQKEKMRGRVGAVWCRSKGKYRYPN